MRYHNITHEDMLNGDGLRVVLWVAGCEHCCPECQNPVTWDPEGGLAFDKAAKEEIFGQLDKSYISGITFSGGDPMHPANKGDVRQLMKEKTEKDPSTMLFFLLTNIIEENSIILCSGAKAEEILKQSNHIEEIPSDGLLVPGMVSRKKQFLPSIIATLQQ